MKMIWPQERKVTVDEVMVWAQDDIANGASFLFQAPDEVRTLEDAIMVLKDSGTVTLAKGE